MNIKDAIKDGLKGMVVGGVAAALPPLPVMKLLLLLKKALCRMISASVLPAPTTMASVSKAKTVCERVWGLAPNPQGK